MIEGWHGWDEYAQFYDWENRLTLGRLDVGFWRNLARKAEGPVLELGCGTGRISMPLARAGVRLVGVDRSSNMLRRARHRMKRSDRVAGLLLTRADIRQLPFPAQTFPLAIAPYGILQSLVRDSDLQAALAETARTLAPGGTFGIDLVPDLPRWKEYRRQTRLRGYRHHRESFVTLVESVRQDRRRGLTIFDQEFTERRGTKRVTKQFSLTFRTLSVRQMMYRLDRAGLKVTDILGDYAGRRWDPRADVWVILARKP